MDAFVLQLGDGIVLLLPLVAALLTIVGLWRIFSKAGHPGWLSLIPILNLYVALKIGGNSGWWLLGLFVPLVNLYVLFRMCDGISRSFGQSLGFTLGLLFLTFVFVPLLGFGDYRYQGAVR